jgi:hypothetical protein
MSQATLSGGYYNSNLFSNTYLDSRVQQLDGWDCDTQAEISLQTLQGLWERESDAVSAYKEDQLIDQWIAPALEVLGYETLSETSLPSSGGYVDRLLLGSDGDRRDAAKLQSEGDLRAMYGRGLGILEAKQWDADFGASLHREGNYRDASQQIKHYLERTPEGIDWGILTDGKKWRLYGTKDYQTRTYYEVDLPELIESGSVEAFKRFFAFFRAEALQDYGGTNFLETVYAESETAAQELGEDLQDQVFTALRVLGRGLIETNDLDVGAEGDVSRDDLKEQSLVLLYRLMFLLYAESRQLINPDDPRARQQYEEAFSLEHLRDDVLETLGGEERFDYHYNEYATGMWARLTDLFGLVDTGNDDLGIPPYNGGLFDDEDHSFLADNEVNDRHLAEVIYRISTTTGEDGEVVRADYGDLDTRHLGSIYEGLLEHQFTIAEQSMAAVREDGGQTWVPATDVSAAEAVETVEAGDLYVVNDDGERKATGAYYTPDYVVTYIVEETVDPLVEEIREDLQAEGFDRHGASGEYVLAFASRITDLKILDPAMGSGHFLTKATGYLTRQVLDEAAALGVGGTFKEDHVRRQIAKECIYGVDLNEMAVELAKLSMWLETLAADQPLAFLDHHLKAGNSLVGSDIEEIEGLESDTNGDSGQSSLAEFGATREGTIERLMEIYGEFLAIENEDLDDVKAMERKYEQIQEDDLRKRLVAMANVRTAEDFGLDVPGGAYERMARSLESDSDWADVEETDWFRSAQSLAEDESFFHWKLEFPEVYYNSRGDPLSRSGFDSIVGNPPYVPTEQIPRTHREYLTSTFEVLYRKYDLSVAFLQQTFRLCRSEGQVGMITPVAWETGENYSRFRSYNFVEGNAGVEK